MSYNNYNRGYAEPTMTSADYMTRTYRWMALGLLVTFAAAFVTATTPLFYVVNSLYLLFTIAELALVFVLSARVQNMSVGAARGVFLGYALLNGMVLSYYFLAFEVGTLVLAFLATSLYFGLMAVYGTTTHKDLSGWGPKLMMALFALLITGFVGLLPAPKCCAPCGWKSWQNATLPSFPADSSSAPRWHAFWWASPAS